MAATLETVAPAALTPREAGRYIGGVAEQTLANWRHLGTGPRFVRLGKVGGRVVYRVADLDAWLDAQTVAQ